jgi:hypothetical protein
MRRLSLAVRAAALAVLTAWASPCAAVTLLLGLEPGASTRADADRVLGQPVRTAGDEVEYAGQGGSARIVVTMRAGGAIIDRIDVHMAPAVGRADVVAALRLPAAAEATGTAGGSLVEFYGTPHLLMLAHESASASSGIVRVGYCSAEEFARLTAAATPRGREDTTAPPPPPPPPAVSNVPPVTASDPSACADLYMAASDENRAVRRLNNVARRQAILAVMIAAQKGDCAKARQLLDAYRKTYQRP